MPPLLIPPPSVVSVGGQRVDDERRVAVGDRLINKGDEDLVPLFGVEDDDFRLAPGAQAEVVRLTKDEHGDTVWVLRDPDRNEEEFKSNDKGVQEGHLHFASGGATEWS
eukprot:gene25609-11811_t